MYILGYYKGVLSFNMKSNRGKQKQKQKQKQKKKEKKKKKERKKNLTNKMQMKNMSLLNEIQIKLRCHPCLCRSTTWDDQV